MSEPPSLPRDEELLTHGRFLRALACSLVTDPERADDLVQDTWATALARPPAHGGAVRAWLARVLRSNAIKTGLRERERPAREETAFRARGDAPGGDPAALAVEIELSRRVLECVERLREPYRSTIYLRYYRGLLPEQIAAEQGVPVKTVKTRLARGLEHLREDLDRLHGGRREAWVFLLLPLARLEPLAPAPTVPTTSAPALPWLAGAALAVAAAGSAVFFVVRRDEPAPRVEPAEQPLERVADAPPTAVLDDAGATAGRTPIETPRSTTPASAAHIRLRGRVVDVEGAPLAGAEIRAVTRELGRRGPRGGRPWEWRDEERELDEVRAHSDARGDFELVLAEPGLVRVSVEHAGFGARGQRLLAFAGQELDLGALTLVPGIELAGTVRDPAGPLAGAELFLAHTDEGLSFGPPEPELLRVGSSDDAGAFLLDRVPAGPWRLEARSPGHLPATLAGETSVSGTRVADLALELAAGESIGGTVIGFSADELARARVVARGANEAGASAPVGPDGSFHLDGLAAGAELELGVLLQDRDAGFASEPVRARAGSAGIELVARPLGQTREARGTPATDVQSDATHSLEVHVRDAAGAARPGALVALRATNAPGRGFDPDEVRASDREGCVRFDGLAPGRHALRVVAGVFDLDAHAAADWREVEVPSTDSSVLELEAPASVRLLGRVSVAGQALAAAEIRVRARDSGGERHGPPIALRARSDAAGGFVFSGLAPGEYELELTHAERTLPTRRTLQLGTADAEVTLALASGAYTAFVRDERGLPLAGVRVRPRGDEQLQPFESARRAALATTDEAGRFELSGLDPEGTTAVELEAPGRATLALELRGTTGEFTLAPEAGLTLDLVGGRAPHYRLVARDAAGERRSFGVADGHATLTGLHAGTWTLSLLASERGPRGGEVLAERTLELDAGRATTVRWELP